MKPASPLPSALLGALLLLAGTAAGAGTVSVIVTDKDGKLVPDAVVVVTSQAGANNARTPPGKAVIVQEKMQFNPPLSVLPLGTRVSFVNNDRWEHHVRGSAAGLAQFTAGTAGGFELRLGGKADGKPAEAAEVTLDKAGAVLLGCHIHGSMRGHVYVADTPWAARTTPEGQAVFTDVPDGAAQVRVWHADQLIDLPAQAVTVGAAPARLSVQLQVVPRRRRI